MNVPKWSKPDYKNETTEEEKLSTQCTKDVLLGKIDNPSQEPPVVEGQTNIATFFRRIKVDGLSRLFSTLL